MISEPITDTWPEADLESVPYCPACGDANRHTLYEGLVDYAFRTAPGRWSLHSCENCGSAYLDPRPTSRSIARAYTGYYTHSNGNHSIVRRKGRIRSLLHDWINGYQNSLYGTRRSPAKAAGRWLLPLIPPLRAAADAECRHLPRLPESGGRLLDIGCGNGDFLALATQAGWAAQGIDFDPDAVSAAHTRGLDVQTGGIEVLHNMRECFDVITMNHVIEHIYDPLRTMQHVHSLLKPGGLFWLDTPNVESLGLRRYGAHWRGLEVPRHLVLFSPRSLNNLLHTAGFGQTRRYWRGMVVFNVYAESEAIQTKCLAAGASSDGKPPFAHVLDELREMLRPAEREFITMAARK